jgi:hypothetical protein
MDFPCARDVGTIEFLAHLPADMSAAPGVNAGGIGTSKVGCNCHELSSTQTNCMCGDVS